MLLYPEVQRKAQAEVDRVVGRDRLPDFSDEGSLPYVSAIVKEVLRLAYAHILWLSHRSLPVDIDGGRSHPWVYIFILLEFSV